MRTVLKDSFGRAIRDLRISVTDRCNFKCFYCKSAKGFDYVEKERLLSFEEIARLTRVFVRLGIRKVRLTGGEPLLRKDLHELTASLATIPDIEDLALTTNGFNFYRLADVYRRAGLHRVTISLDSLDRQRFLEITGQDRLAEVLNSIRAANEAGFSPVKVNCVVIRGVNDDEIVDFVEFARELRLSMRFIEFMPIDEDEQWSREQVVTGEEILSRLGGRFELVPRGLKHPSDTARVYDFADGRGQLGLILPVSRPFCGACSRIRLTADGKLRTCLFSVVEHDIKSLLRNGADDAELIDFVQATVLKKEASHRINEPDFQPPSRSMSYIGG